MNTVIAAYLIVPIIAIGSVTMAADEPGAQTTEKQKTQITEKQKIEATAEVSAALKQFSSEVKAILTAENIHSMLDRPRLFKELGVTYQPELVAADDLAPRLSGCNLRIYAGIKMYDAIYAAVFSKKQEVAKSIQAIDEVMQKLDLRSYADFSGHMRETVRKAANETENIDIKEMIDRLTADFLNELPVFLSSSESSHFLADSLYGFLIESIYIKGYFLQTLKNDGITQHRSRPTSIAWMNAVSRVLDAFEKARKDLHVGNHSLTLDYISDIKKDLEDEYSGKNTAEQARERVAAIRERVAKKRASVLADAK